MLGAPQAEVQRFIQSDSGLPQGPADLPHDRMKSREKLQTGLLADRTDSQARTNPRSGSYEKYTRDGGGVSSVRVESPRGPGAAGRGRPPLSFDISGKNKAEKFLNDQQ